MVVISNPAASELCSASVSLAIYVASETLALISSKYIIPMQPEMILPEIRTRRGAVSLQLIGRWLHPSECDGWELAARATIILG